MRALGFFDRRVRGFRIVELGAMSVLVVLVLVVYLAKDGAGDKRADIDRVQQDIVAEQDQIRLLKAEVAHQEQPERLEALSGQYLNLQPIAAKHEVDAAALADVARVGSPVVAAAAASPLTGLSVAQPSIKSVTPGLVPGAQDHERNAASAGVSAPPSVFLGPRDKPGGDGSGHVPNHANLARRDPATLAKAAPTPVASAH